MQIRFRMLFVVAVSLTGSMMVVSAVEAATIEVGSIPLLANTPDQQVVFSVTGTENVRGMEFDIQIGDGGSNLGGTDTAPIITAIDLLSDTIFASANPVQTNVVAFPLARQSSVDASGTVTANGRIATVTFDTTGVSSGVTIALLLSNVAGQFNTTFFDAGGGAVTTNVTNGQLVITAIPEPADVAMLCGLAAVLGLFGWRRRRRPVGQGNLT